MTTVPLSHPPPPSPLAQTVPARLLPLAVLLAGTYIGAQMLADIASLKIGIVARLAVDMGTFIYPITFTLRDLVHKALGKRAALVLVVTAAVINVLMAFYLWAVAAAPSDPAWGLHAEFKAILAPVGRIVAASILAEVVSQLVNTEVYAWFRRRTRRHQWVRVLVSNSAAVPVDNLLFAVGAFAFTLPLGVVAQIFAANLVLKMAVTLVGLPLIYLIPSRLEFQDPEPVRSREEAPPPPPVD